MQFDPTTYELTALTQPSSANMGFWNDMGLLIKHKSVIDLWPRCIKFKIYSEFLN